MPQKGSGLGYGFRSEVLLRNGFASYRLYLESELWASIRERVLTRDHHACVCCEYPATQVHHLSYGDVTIRGERIDKLVSLCGGCHTKVEFKNGRKLPFAEASRRLNKIKKWARKRKRREAKRLAYKLLS